MHLYEYERGQKILIRTRRIFNQKTKNIPMRRSEIFPIRQNKKTKNQKRTYIEEESRNQKIGKVTYLPCLLFPPGLAEVKFAADLHTADSNCKAVSCNLVARRDSFMYQSDLNAY